jgi:hypothetical protein
MRLHVNANVSVDVDVHCNLRNNVCISDLESRYCTCYLRLYIKPEGHAITPTPGKRNCGMASMSGHAPPVSILPKWSHSAVILSL